MGCSSARFRDQGRRDTKAVFFMPVGVACSQVVALKVRSGAALFGVVLFLQLCASGHDGMVVPHFGFQQGLAVCDMASPGAEVDFTGQLWLLV